MKKVIEGVTYDTETANEIATGDPGYELSQAWWTSTRRIKECSLRLSQGTMVLWKSLSRSPTNRPAAFWN